MFKKYKKINYKRFFCVPGCIKAVLLRRKIGKGIDIWTIGRELDLKIPKKFKEEYPNTKISEKGIFQINLHKKEHSFNRFFRKYKLPLIEKYFYRTDKEKIKTLLLKEFKGSDIIAAFDFPTISGMKGKWGHISLINNVSKKEVSLYDPKSSKSIKVSYELLSKAIKTHGRKKRAGFWIIKNK